jgi:NAD(P)-dependent dehydrogenase (short-subunit alcohol dehydrogenase family)
MASKTALVTGGTGFLGRQVVKRFASNNWNAKGTGFSRADGTSILKVDLAKGEEIERALDEQK